jgi:hypothetical protein
VSNLSAKLSYPREQYVFFIPWLFMLKLAAWVMLAVLPSYAAHSLTGDKWPAHPRLRLNDTGLDKVRAVTGATGDPLAKELLRNISAWVDHILAQPVSSGADLLNSLQEDIYPLGLLYRLSTNLTQRKILAHRAIAELLIVTKLDAWSQRTEMGDIRFLTIAETMHGVSIGYDWFYDALTKEQRTTIEDGLYRDGLRIGMECYSYNCSWVPGIPGIGNCSSCWWIRATHMNWNVVGNGGMTIAALALADVPRYANVSQHALAYARKGIPLAISGYGPDGAWPEGPGYWVYTTKWLLATTEALETATGQDYGYMETPGVNDTANYVLQMYETPSGMSFNYGDVASSDRLPNIDVASNLLGLAARFPELGAVTTATAHRSIQSPAVDSIPAGSRGWDAAALALMRWDPTHEAPHDLAELPQSAFYSAQAVGVVRSGWNTSSAYLGARGGDSTVTHQDLDHGTFVWDTRGYRWAIDLGTENYGLPQMFLPFSGRYRYYRKSTRGHNTLAFRDPGGFDPADGEASDQAVNTFSSLIPGSACKTDILGVTSCGAGEVMVVNLTDAYGPQLPSGLPDPSVPASARPVVSRAFHVNAKMTELLVVDSISNSHDNVSWAMHTRAASISLHGSTAILVADTGIRMQIRLESTPPGVCSSWNATLVKLPNGTLHNQTRFPLYGAKKVWSVCQSMVTELRVTLSDL